MSLFTIEIKCLKCGIPVKVDSWYLREIEEGREEQLCDKCKDEIMDGQTINEIINSKGSIYLKKKKVIK